MAQSDYMLFTYKVNVHLCVRCENTLSRSCGLEGRRTPERPGTYAGWATRCGPRLIDPAGATTYSWSVGGNAEEPSGGACKDDRHARGNAPGDTPGGLRERGEPPLGGREWDPGSGSLLRGRAHPPGGRGSLGPGAVPVRPPAGIGRARDYGRHHREGVRLRGVEQLRLRAGDSGAGARFGEPLHLFARPERAGDERDPRARERGAEERVAPAHGPLREGGLLRPYRARGGLRPRLPRHHGGR